jgi:RES domain-containing protein
LRFIGRCFRGHDPGWSFSPISGGGAAITGGRFNRKEVATLYLSLDVMTAIGECTQGFSRRLQPLTMCEYDVDCEDIADLRDDAGRATHGVRIEDLACSWLTEQRAGRNAPSWLVADSLRASGHNGILVPSFVPGSTAGKANLVLWRWGPDLPRQVRVYDPAGRLPKDRLSWS